MLTEQELISMQLKYDARERSTEFIIRDLISKHDTEGIKKGVKYYHNESDIKDRKIYYYDADGNKVLDREATNHRIPYNWHKLLVDQKVSYLLGNPAVINADPDRYQELINEYLDEEWDDRLQEIGKNSSNKGAEYLHPYVDEEGNFKYIIIPREQSVPVYDTDYQEEITYFLRYYPVVVNGKERIRAEWWDSESVTYYIQSGGLFEMEEPEEGRSNPEYHFYLNNQGMGWGKPPFVEFRNNEEMYSDLKYYKEIADIYDLVNSDLANDLTDIQKFIYVLKGYGGESLREFMQNLRYYRAIEVDPEQGAGVDTVGIDPPVNAIDSFLDRQEENIFLFGQGVNIKTDRFGQSPSGVALKFLFHLLDLKADIMARKFSAAIKEFIRFLTIYMQAKGEGSFDPSQVSVVFNKSMLMNTLEQTQIAQASQGIISQETIMSNHPWVEDVDKEKEKMDEEREEAIQYQIDNFPMDEEEEEE